MTGLEKNRNLSKICPSCATGNPPRHRYCHQCGAPLGKEPEPLAVPPTAAPDAAPPAAKPFPVRPADESRLPPPGSFRAGVYRLARALFINQGPSRRPKPPRASPRPPETPTDIPPRAETPAAGPAPNSAGHESRLPQDSFRAGVYWLTLALLIRHLLPRSVRPPAYLPVPAETPPTAAPRQARWRVPSGIGVPSGLGGQLSGLSGQLSGMYQRAGAALTRAQAVLTPAEELSIPRYAEVAVVTALTLVALFLRVWNLPDTPPGLHGDETEVAMEALRSLRGESIGIWIGVTLGNPAGFAHWTGLIFRLAGADTTTMRLAAAIPGAAIIPVGYLLVRRLFSCRVAILSAAMLTFSFWFLIQSRIALPGITAIFMALLVMWLIIAAVQSRRRWVAVAAGIALGLGIYTFKMFLIYFVAFWGAALLVMLLDGGLRKRIEIWWFLGVSVVVAAPLLLFYATSDYIGPNLNDLYGVSLSSPSTWVRIPGLAADAILLAHLPIEGNTLDGAPAIPLLPLAGTAFFWAGLAVLLLFIRQGRYQLLLLGWLVGMAPILIAPGAESRRYLLGIFFVIVLVAVGMDAALIPLGRKVRELCQARGFTGAGTGRVALGISLVAIVVFVGLFAGSNLREFSRWGNSESLKWFFYYDQHQAFLFLETLEGDPAAVEYEVRFYSARLSFDSSVRRFVLPDAKGTDGSEEHGGDGAIPPRGEIAGATIFVLMDKYLPLAAALEAEYPEAEKIDEPVEEGRTAVPGLPGPPASLGASVHNPPAPNPAGITAELPR